MLALIDRADPADPIARQFVPSAAETEISADELADPIGDEARSPVKGIVHRYPDRVLLKPLHVCPVYCRFCFRREKVGPGRRGAVGRPSSTPPLAYIRARPEIWEVILTGGDPLMLAPRRLGELIAALDAIDHVGVIRIHSRVPIVDPVARDRRASGGAEAAARGAVARRALQSRPRTRTPRRARRWRAWPTPAFR